MFQFLVRPSLTILRILIVAGALASVVEPRLQSAPVSLSLVNFYAHQIRVVTLDSNTVFRLIFTAVGLSLL